MFNCHTRVNIFFNLITSLLPKAFYNMRLGVEREGYTCWQNIKANTNSTLVLGYAANLGNIIFVYKNNQLNFIEICSLKCWNQKLSNLCTRFVYNNMTRECINCIPPYFYEINIDTNIYFAPNGT